MSAFSQDPIVNSDLKLEAKILGNLLGSGIQLNYRLGQSQEFSQYKLYTPGDDPRLIDWKKYVQTGKKWLKQGQNEKNINCCFIIDFSDSVNYLEAGISRGKYIKKIASTLAYLAFKQGDTLALIKTNGEKVKTISKCSAYNIFLSALDTEKEELNLNLLSTLPADSIVVFISDFFNDFSFYSELILKFKAKKNDVRLCQVLGQNEKSFDFKNEPILYDLENPKSTFPTDKVTKNNYLENFNKHQGQLISLANSYGFDFHTYFMGEDPLLFLRKFLRNT